MPYVDVSRIPFLAGTKIYSRKNVLLCGTYIPQLGRDTTGQGRGVVVGSPDWNKMPPVDDLPTDSLRIDVFDISGQEKVKAISDRASTRLLQLLRWSSRQWWIGRSVDALLSFIRNDFPVSQDSAFLDRNSALVQFRDAIAGDEQPIDNVLWHTCIENLRQNIEAPIHELIVCSTQDILRT